MEVKSIGGVETYVAELKPIKHRDFDIYVRSNGTLLKLKEEIPFSRLPASVRSTVKRYRKGGEIDDVEMVTEKKKITYIVEIDNKGSADLKITLSKTGKVLKKI